MTASSKKFNRKAGKIKFNAVIGLHRIKVSAKNARLRFNGCEPDYIKNVCHAHCCESSTAPSGTFIAVHPTEEKTLEARGGKILNGLLQSVNRKCPFKTSENLCGLHFTKDKPFGCIASPLLLILMIL